MQRRRHASILLKKKCAPHRVERVKLQFDGIADVVDFALDPGRFVGRSSDDSDDAVKHLDAPVQGKREGKSAGGQGRAGQGRAVREGKGQGMKGPVLASTSQVQATDSTTHSGIDFEKMRRRALGCRGGGGIKVD